MLFMDEATRRRLRGIQDGWLEKQRQQKPAPKAKPPKINRDRHRHLVETTATILKTGQPTHFAYEGACRYGLRSGFIRDGWSWTEADTTAADIVATALRFIGAKRPSWKEGQPEHSQEGFSPIEHTRCVRCGGKIPETNPNSGWERRYCSNVCSNGDRLQRERISGERFTLAQYWAAMAVRGEAKRRERERPCEWCGTIYIQPHATEPSRFCSKSCTAKATGEKRKRFKPCEACGKRYHVSGPGAGKRYCSKACWNSVYEIRPKNCEWCAALFRPKARHVRFCSARCSARWRVSHGRTKPSSGFRCDVAE